MFRDKDFGFRHWNLPDYFFGDIETRDQYYWQMFASGLPGIGAFYRARDSQRYMDDYLSNSGLSYGDIKYPTRTPGAGFSGAGSYVSSNLTKLYR